jgi:superfamily II DNA/RNA helicase
MREMLSKWISDAEAIRQFEHFKIPQQILDLSYVRQRSDDYYTALVGELFDKMRDGFADPKDWAKLGNAIALFTTLDGEKVIRSGEISQTEAFLFSAAAFYFGGFPASSYLILTHCEFNTANEEWAACYDLLARPKDFRSRTVAILLKSIAAGHMEVLARITREVKAAESKALWDGPRQWIPLHLLSSLLDRFNRTNLRAVLPEGDTEFWNQFVASMLDRKPPSWEFFPSQIQAIENGLLSRPDTCSLQMPTGAGKTALTETLLYWHLKKNPLEVAILLVPFRSLASELRNSLVVRLNNVHISARAAYGGTIPSTDEINDLDRLQVLVSTPETLSGLLAANPLFLKRVSLVICDEGHLLDSDSRGISLELLLARMKVRESGQPRFVFISAIVPNIEEINSWLAGNIYPGFVVRSEYRPALAEFALLSPHGSGTSSGVDLLMHPHESTTTRFPIKNFLAQNDFCFRNPISGRQNTYHFTSVKAQALAAARKSLSMGAVAVFACNKRGDQGAIGLAEGLLNQLNHTLTLPRPDEFMIQKAVDSAAEYLTIEYGNTWVGTRALQVGAVLHHGDIPQETREVLEGLLRQGQVKFAICTSTLAEGVNLPIRTLILYSVQRRQAAGPPENMLGRDIKNLVGRAGRAGVTTKGLVICANPEQWKLILPVAKQAAGEPVYGALLPLIKRVKSIIALKNIVLSNDLLDRSATLGSMIDGVDATLIDLASEEVGQERLTEIAIKLAGETFAAKQMDASTKEVLQTIFKLRAEKVISVRATGRLLWIRETGAKLRMIDIVEKTLLPALANWEDVADPIDAAFVTAILTWAWGQESLIVKVRQSFRLADDVKEDTVREKFFGIVRMWIAGASFREMSTSLKIEVDDLLGIYTQVISFELQTIVEQGIALLRKLLEGQGKVLSLAVEQFPKHLRFGVPTITCCILAEGLRHRRAAVELGRHPILEQITVLDRKQVFAAAQAVLKIESRHYQVKLGRLMYEQTNREVTKENARNNA